MPTWDGEQLFADESWDDEFALRSPIPRRVRRKKPAAEEIACIIEEDSEHEDREDVDVGNIENEPPVAEAGSDRSAIERMNAEFSDLEDYSLYIENEDGVRLKPVGNKLVEYEKYDGPKSTAHVLPKKTATPTMRTDAEREAEAHKIRKAVWSYARSCIPRKHRSSIGALAAPGTSIPNESAANERHRRTTYGAFVATEPIEETPETESTEVLSTRNSRQEPEQNVPSPTFAVTPKVPRNLPMLCHYDDVNTASTMPLSRPALQDLSFSSFSQMNDDLHAHAHTSTPVQRGPPQAQSTPFELDERKCSGAPALESQSDFTSPRWANVTGRSKERTLSRISRGSSPFDAPLSPPKIDDSFENADSCVIPEVLGRRSSEQSLLDELENGVVTDDKEDEDLAAQLRVSMELSPCHSGHDISCNTMATLAEDVPFQVTQNAANLTRNVTQMTTNNTRNISCMTNASFLDIPFYLSGCPEAASASPLTQLLHVIGQAGVIEWAEMPEDVFVNPRKLGEGVYGEVFATSYKGQPTALKVIPFHGDKVVYDGKVNGEYLLDAAGMLPEILINRELSALYDPSGDFSTPNFIQLLKTNVVRGEYPESLLVAWDEFDEEKESENDRPTEYATKEQLFITMGMAMGGSDLEHFQMKNEDQVISTLLQVTISLIVAEVKLEFEHRDLHIGNVLVLEEDTDLEYKYNGGTMALRSYGVRVNLIDFTLSRMRKEGTTIFRDLESDEELFAGTGDYQFDIYRMMRHENQGDWMAFTPKTNCFWLHYLSKQLISKRKCKKAIPKKRRLELQSMWDQLLNFDTLRDIFTCDHFHDVLERHLTIKEWPKES
ncbi:hypothetical protein ANCCEY_01085 [Ancylostoma ceylanicum]|uniref:non-specific serine/threonine protein kinase n=1 Tax=Ancylostoma ceylanicum TaxID=53326 RepID=A0A0D6M6V9_9BILA|nr:hypothetical protein ANCCEY_01085 [Ancylostoma ceylanicum]